MFFFLIRLFVYSGFSVYVDVTSAYIISAVFLFSLDVSSRWTLDQLGKKKT